MDADGQARRVCPVQGRILVFEQAFVRSIPKGIAQSSPRLRGTSYLGEPGARSHNPERVAPHKCPLVSRTGRNPVGVEIFCLCPQGCSCLATLGFGTESRWDSPMPAFLKTWDAPSQAGRFSRLLFPIPSKRPDDPVQNVKSCFHFLH